MTAAADTLREIADAQFVGEAINLARAALDRQETT